MQKNKKKIFFCIPNFNAGGAEQVMINLFKEFDDQNNILVTLNNEGPLISKIPTKRKLISLNCKKSKYSILQFSRLFNREKPNVIISTMGYFNFIIMISILFSNHRPNKIILREANTVSSTISINWVFKYLYKFLYNKADTVICNSKEIFDQLILFGVGEDKVKIIPNFVVQKEIQEKAKKIISLPNFNNSNLPLLISVGRLVKQKGMDRLINWFSKLKTKSNLLILGEGPNKNQLEKDINNFDLMGRVILLGHVSNPYPFIFASNALLIGSRWEGFPNVALESLSLGVPVITTDQSGGLVEIKNLIDKKWLKISKNEEEFISFMESVTKRKEIKKYISYKSKLPDIYKKEKILPIFRKLILN